MSNYVKLTDYAAKDALLSGNPAKIVKGVDIGADFDAVAVAVATKYDDTIVVAATSKTTPVDADLIPLVDSAASNVLKKLTWANLKATLATWLETLTATWSNKTLTSPVISGGTINNAAIGGTTPAAGAFTTLSASGNISGANFYGTTNGNTYYLDLATNNGMAVYGSSGANPNSINFYAAGSARASLTSTGLNSTAIGATTPSTGAFTTLSATGNISQTDGFGLVWGTGVDTFIHGSHGSGYIRQRVGGTDITNVTSTGLSVTGTLSATGNITATGTGNLQTSNAVETLNSSSLYQYNIGSTTFWRQRNNANNLEWSYNGGGVSMTLASSGLSVTGSSSAVALGATFTLGGTATSGKSYELIYNAGNGVLHQAYDRTGSAYINMTYDALTHRWNDLGTGTPKMTLDASGNFGLGVTPSAWNSAYKTIQLGSSSFSGGITGYVGNAQTFVHSNCYHNGTNWIYTNTTGAAKYSVQGVGSSHVWSIAASGTAGNTITWTDAMTLDASGNLGVAQTPITSLNSTAGATIAAVGYMQIQRSNSVQCLALNSMGSNTGNILGFNYNSSLVGAITITTTTTSLTTSSDHRMKVNVRDADAKRFQDIRFVDFEWDVDGRHDCGVIAHELQAIYPDLVVGEKDAVDEDGKPKHQQVNYGGLIPRMGVHIQKLMARVDQLEADKAALLQVLASVDNRLKAGGL